MSIERRRVGQPEQVYQRIGSRRLAPGFWEDAEGHLHVSVPELLAVFELEDTPENRRQVEEMVLEMFRQQLPAAQVVVQEEEEGGADADHEREPT